MLDALSLLALQLEWGADEALLPEPVSRLQAVPAAATAAPLPVPRPRGETGPVAAGPPPPAAAAIERPAAASAPAAPVPVAARSADTAPANRPGVAGRGPAAISRAIAEAATDLDALRAAITGFDGSLLRDTATRSVLPAGSAPATVAIIGEVPDEDEDRAGYPFAGRAGALLDQMLASIGLNRGGTLLLPLIPWRPPGGRAPSQTEMAGCQPFAERALVLAQPRFILCMGSRPARAVADSAIRAGAGWRRPVIAGLPETTQVLPMRHPSYLLSHLPARKDAWADLIRLRRGLDAWAAPVPITAA